MAALAASPYFVEFSIMWRIAGGANTLRSWRAALSCENHPAMTSGIAP